MMKIKLLGHCSIQVDGVELVNWPRKDCLLLLKLLAIEISHKISRKQIFELLWNNISGNQEHRLNNALYDLRNTLEAGRNTRGLSSYIHADKESIWLVESEVVWIDIDHFERLIDIGLIDQIDTLEIGQALEIYDGDLLQGDESLCWTTEPRKHLRERYLGTLRIMAARQELQGNTDGTIETLKRIAQAIPSDELVHRELIALLVRQGRMPEAQQQYVVCRQSMARELGLAPCEQTRFALKPIENFEVNSTFGKRQLPQLSAQLLPSYGAIQTLIGRQKETKEVCELFRSNHRLVTLTGTGGVGKTQLSIRIAQVMQTDLANDICFVALEDVASPRAVASAIGRALGLKQSGVTSWESLIIGLLNRANLFMVIDNFEHVLDAAPLLSRLVSSVPGLKILCTSRARLDISAEYVYVLSPLEIPATREKNIANVPAIALFVQRATATNRHFCLTEDNIHSVSAICRRLDGLPLAIELAAARVNLFGCNELQRRLDISFDVVSTKKRDGPVRHKSLDSVLAWSFQLIPDWVQYIFKRMAMFAGGLTVNNACGAMSLSREVIEEAFEILISNNLIVIEEGRNGSLPRRFRLLQTVRAYSLSQLALDPECAVAWNNFVIYWTRQSQLIANDDRSIDYLPVLLALKEDFYNYEAAVIWAASNQRDLSHHFIAVLASAAGRRGFGTEVQRWIALSLPEEEAITSTVHAKASYAASALFLTAGNFRVAVLHVQKILAEDWYSDNSIIARSLSLRGYLYHVQGNIDQAVLMTRQAHAIASRIGDITLLAISRINLGEMLVKKGRYDEAQNCYDVGMQNLSLLSPGRVVGLFYLMSQLKRLRGQYKDSHGFGVKCVEHARASSDLRMLGWALAAFAEQLILMGHMEDGLVTIDESCSINDRVGDHALMVSILRVKGLSNSLQGYHVEAIEHLSSAIAVCRTVNFEVDIDVLWLWLTRSCWATGQIERAQTHLYELLLMKRELHHYFVPCVLEEAVKIFMYHGDLHCACESLKQASAVRAHYKLVLTPVEAVLHTEMLAQFQRQFGANILEKLAPLSNNFNINEPLSWLIRNFPAKPFESA